MPEPEGNRVLTRTVAVSKRNGSWPSTLLESESMRNKLHALLLFLLCDFLPRASQKDTGSQGEREPSDIVLGGPETQSGSQKS